jgi:hypothetical protein
MATRHSVKWNSTERHFIMLKLLSFWDTQHIDNKQYWQPAYSNILTNGNLHNDPRSNDTQHIYTRYNNILYNATFITKQGIITRHKTDGIMTHVIALGIMTQGIMTQSIITQRIMTEGIMTYGIMALGIMTLSTTIRKCDTQQSNKKMRHSA